MACGAEADFCLVDAVCNVILMPEACVAYQSHPKALWLSRTHLAALQKEAKPNVNGGHFLVQAGKSSFFAVTT
jgi:hypothetical protein